MAAPYNGPPNSNPALTIGMTLPRLTPNLANFSSANSICAVLSRRIDVFIEDKIEEFLRKSQNTVLMND